MIDCKKYLTKLKQMPLKSFIKAIAPILATKNTVPTIEYRDREKKKEMNILEHKNKLK